MKRVFIEKCKTYKKEEVYNSIKRIFKSMNFEIPVNKTVFIKPNIMAQNKPEQHSVTHFSVIEALCILLKENNCKIQIGDSIAFYQKGLTKKAFETTRIKDVAGKYGAELVALDEEPLVRVSKNTTVIKELFIPKKILNAELVINACKMKTHSGLRLSCAIKNMFGILPGGYKQKIHIWTKNDFELSDVFIDLCNIVKPGLYLMDAIVALDGGPSAMGKGVPVGMILASKNPAALDATACKIIGYEPEDIATLVRARKRKMIDSFDHIEVVYRQQVCKIHKTGGYNLNFSNVKFNKQVKGPLKIHKAKDGVWITDTFVNPKIIKSKCSKCGDCIVFCPVKAISMEHNKYPYFDRERCINCYYCISACPKNAIGIKSSFKNKLIRFLRFLLKI